MVEKLLKNRHPEDPRTDDEVREQNPIGEKKLYALVVTEIQDPVEVEEWNKLKPDEVPEARTIKSINIVTLFESEIEDWVERNNLVYTDTPANVPRFVDRNNTEWREAYGV